MSQAWGLCGSLSMSTDNRERVARVAKARGGLTYVTSVTRLRGAMPIPDPKELTESGSGLWGEAEWTDEDVQKMLVRLVSEGMSLGQATDALTTTYPNMPSRWKVNYWRRNVNSFRGDIEIAEQMYADTLADAATEIALATTPEEAKASAVKLKHLEWKAGKMNRRRYDDKQEAPPDPGIQNAPVERLMAELKSLMRDSTIRDALGSEAKTIGIVDVEIVEDISNKSKPEANEEIL